MGVQFEHKPYIPELDYIAYSSMPLKKKEKKKKKITQSETMQDLSVHSLPQFYQPQQVPTTVWTALMIWYTCHKAVHYQNSVHPRSKFAN